MKILDVGCGKAKTKGAIGIDWSNAGDVDIAHDLNTFPWPIKDSEFDLVICKDIIEHLDNIVKTMEEIHRLAKHGAKVIIDTPHFANPNSYRDPTHKWHFSYDTFDYFSTDFTYPIYSQKRFKILKKKFIFSKSMVANLGKLLAKISVKWYEIYFSRVCPPYKLYFELEVIK